MIRVCIFITCFIFLIGSHLNNHFIVIGNEFSSVDGLVFRWTFEGHSSDVESGNEPVLRWVKFADSSYEVIPSIEALETVGYQGHVILIEGMRTGSARVSVRLEDDAFKVVEHNFYLVNILDLTFWLFVLERPHG